MQSWLAKEHMFHTTEPAPLLDSSVNCMTGVDCEPCYEHYTSRGGRSHLSDVDVLLRDAGLQGGDGLVSQRQLTLEVHDLRGGAGTMEWVENVLILHAQCA